MKVLIGLAGLLLMWLAVTNRIAPVIAAVTGAGGGNAPGSVSKPRTTNG